MLCMLACILYIYIYIHTYHYLYTYVYSYIYIYKFKDRLCNYPHDKYLQLSAGNNLHLPLVIEAGNGLFCLCSSQVCTRLYISLHIYMYHHTSTCTYDCSYKCHFRMCFICIPYDFPIKLPDRETPKNSLATWCGMSNARIMNSMPPPPRLKSMGWCRGAHK